MFRYYRRVLKFRVDPAASSYVCWSRGDTYNIDTY